MSSDRYRLEHLAHREGQSRRHLFTPFFTTKQNGQGIGLTMVQEILRQHGFDYSLDGPPGGPTVFRLCVGATTPT